MCFCKFSFPSLRSRSLISLEDSTTSSFVLLMKSPSRFSPSMSLLPQGTYSHVGPGPGSDRDPIGRLPQSFPTPSCSWRSPPSGTSFPQKVFLTLDVTFVSFWLIWIDLSSWRPSLQSPFLVRYILDVRPHRVCSSVFLELPESPTLMNR